MKTEIETVLDEAQDTFPTKKLGELNPGDFFIHDGQISVRGWWGNSENSNDAEEKVSCSRIPWDFAKGPYKLDPELVVIPISSIRISYNI